MEKNQQDFDVWSWMEENKPKTLDEKIVLNSMSLKWNLIIDEFKNLTKKLYFN